MTSLSKYNNDILNKKPTQEVWSTVQVMQHLMAAEMRSLAYMRKKLSFTSQVPKAGFKSRMRRLMLRIAFNTPFKFKAPYNLETFPDYGDFTDLKNKWASQRLDFQTFIETLPDNVLAGEIWNHQIAGKMNIAQMLDFFHDHVKRHQGQIKRTLKQVAS